MRSTGAACAPTLRTRQPPLHLDAVPGPGKGYYYQLLAAAGWTSLPLLPLLRAPTLILAGDDDPLTPVANARIMHRLIPHSELHIYRGGHLDLITHPKPMATIVEAFLNTRAEAPDSTVDGAPARRARWRKAPHQATARTKLISRRLCP